MYVNGVQINFDWNAKLQPLVLYRAPIYRQQRLVCVYRHNLFTLLRSHQAEGWIRQEMQGNKSIQYERQIVEIYNDASRANKDCRFVDWFVEREIDTSTNSLLIERANYSKKFSLEE